MRNLQKPKKEKRERARVLHDGQQIIGEGGFGRLETRGGPPWGEKFDRPRLTALEKLKTDKRSGGKKNFKGTETSQDAKRGARKFKIDWKITRLLPKRRGDYSTTRKTKKRRKDPKEFSVRFYLKVQKETRSSLVGLP